jgi:uncharacterized membrane protein YgcG
MLLLLALSACDTTVDTDFPSCQVDVMQVEPASGLPGDSIKLTAHPVTTTFDTVLNIGGTTAELVSVDRTDCESCDDCRTTWACLECGADCDPCDNLCATTCDESVVFTVPELAAGSYQIEVFNAHGHSDRVAFEVLGVTDTGDSGNGDSGGGDSGGGDSGGGDSDTPDDSGR